MTGEVVGQPLSRVDARLKVTGGATYAAEHRLEDLLHGVVVNAAAARGKVSAIATDAARAHPGVTHVLTDFGSLKLAHSVTELAFYGQAIAVVLATTAEAAAHGASLVEAACERQPALTDFDDPRATSVTAPENPDYSRGDPDGAFGSADAKVDLEFTISRENHNPIELPSTIARWDGGKLTLWDKSQWVQGAARTVAGALGVPEQDVRVHCEYVGGGFGSAIRAYDHVVLAAFAARQAGRPVKVVLGARRFGWSRRGPAPGGRTDGDLLIGMGMATASYHNNRRQVGSRARVDADGTATVATATSDMGPGTTTSVMQVAADALGLPARQVTFRLGDSAYPAAPPHAGATTMASVGSAAHTSCSALRNKFIGMAVADPASPLYRADPAKVAVRDGRLSSGGNGAADSYREILRRAGLPGLEATATWGPGDTDERISSYGYGAVFAEVSVDPLLGLVRIRRMFAAYDVGRVISPKLAHSQAIGGMVGGIGMALLEGTVTDHRDGRIVNAGLADYLVPVNAAVPELDAAFIDTEDPLADPIGVKGLGEITIVGVPAAIGNAVFNATGKRLTDLPIRLEALL
ncbi:xanthine dehydrogenase family protein molybdopterin-binding subunit [Streptomyces sp. NBC_00555]|uniref:xanthine dehydrogenase family protein molybdopterin-binding subunit n=1 Tax=Streptomyces sp. NBC_00555 TaxID=2903662 RepID=UPI00225BF54E|nr:xanthine dehydrogenase family protein molybdopterin-binding subunit [Streptomyces sp. NBC_00555]MCX5010620.1 xanthine dehydrogenase family protein molybdopterin-binding subunit [Streptomyces sp. NBC_00555]